MRPWTWIERSRSFSDKQRGGGSLFRTRFKSVITASSWETGEGMSDCLGGGGWSPSWEQTGRTDERQQQSSRSNTELLWSCFHMCKIGITLLPAQVCLRESAVGILATTYSTENEPHTVLRAFPIRILAIFTKVWILLWPLFSWWESGAQKC